MARQAMLELPLEWARPTTTAGRLASRKLTHECVGGCGAISEPNSKRRHWSCADCRKKAQAAGARRRRLRYEAGKSYDKHAKGLWNNHRMRKAEYLELWRSQGGRCVGCGATSLILHVDHDHRVGCDHPLRSQTSCSRCRRGLLCGDCNRLLGLANDDPATLTALASYLRRY